MGKDWEEKSMDSGSSEEDDVMSGDDDVSDVDQETDVGEDVSAEPPHKKARLNGNELYKAPTSDEINQLKETENLFHSSLFRMQVTELLGEVQLKPKRTAQIEEFINQLSESIKSLRELEERELTDQKWVKKLGHPVKVPLRQEPKQVKGRFRFLPPRQVHVIGSYALRMCTKPDVAIDLAVEIPKECMESKDYLNHRYLRKRALYLTYIAGHLPKYEIISSVEFMHHNGNHMKPVLVITPAGNLGKHCKFHIHTILEEGVFKLSRFHVNKNSIRKQWWLGDQATDKDTEQATPRYNTAVLHDLIHRSHTDDMSRIFQDSQSVRDGIALLKVWLRQRQLNTGRGAMTNFLLTSYVAFLIHSKKLNCHMSSYQIMRNTLLHLRQAQWDTEPISLASFSAPDAQRPEMHDFQSKFEVVFVDGTGYTNLAADVCPATLSVIRNEAELALQFLETPGLDGFDVLFMKATSFLCKVDQVITIQNLEQLGESAARLQLEAELMDNCGDYVQTCLPKLLQLLDTGVGRRINLVHVKFMPIATWEVGKKPPVFTAADRITIGFTMNPDTFTSIVDKGPPADSPEAKEFQAFWGEKSDLRRFQDGSISEAVVWSGTTLCSKRLITGKAIKYILNNHAGIARESISHVAGQLDPLLRPPQRGKKFVQYGTGEEQHSTLIHTYDALCKQLRNLQDFPLAVHSLQGTSPVCRFSEVFPPMPAVWTDFGVVNKTRTFPKPDEACPPYVPSNKVVCILEASGKWPEDAESVKRLKAAFHIKLAELLRNKCNLTTCVHPEHVDVLKGGFVFRVVIGYLKEISLLKLVTTSDGMVRSVETQEALDLERELVTLPKLTTTLLGIYQQYPSYSGAVRLAKRWIAAHMLAAYVPEEAIELLVAYLYLHPAPYHVTASPQTAFLRFLKLLASHDWNTTPLIVNLNNELTKNHYAEIERLFTKNRSTLPLMFIATPGDKHTSSWTKRKPSAQIMLRLASLAAQSAEHLEKQLTDISKDTDFKQIFRTPMDMFDVTIQLRNDRCARRHLAVDVGEETSVPKYKLPEDSKEKLPMPIYNFDPVELFYQELQDAFGRLALFFYDKYGGDVIGVLWKPQAFQPQSFKASSVDCCMVKPDSSGKNLQTVPNVEAIIEDFKTLGAGLVQTIETKTDKWTIQ